MSVWRPLHGSGFVSWRIISTCFLGAINLQDKVTAKSNFQAVQCKIKLGWFHIAVALSD